MTEISKKSTKKSTFSWPVFFLAASMFFTGFAGLVTEYIMGTTIGSLLGGTHVQLKLTIGIMILTMGLGGILQAQFNNKNLIEKFVVVEVLLAIIGSYAPLTLLAVFAHIGKFFPILSLLLVGLLGLLIGFEIPLVMRINEQFVPNLASNTAWIFSLDYIGSFLGAIVWIKFLMPSGRPLTELSFLVAFVNLVVALITFLYFTFRKQVKPLKAGALLLLAVCLLSVGMSRNRTLATHLEQKFFNDPIVYTQTTQYQHIVLTESNSGIVELWLNGHKQFSSYDEKIYHEFLVYPAMETAPRHEKVLILGGGDGLALREVRKYPGVKKIVLVDIDPAMVELARTHPLLKKVNEGAFEDARITIADNPSVYSEKFSTAPILFESKKAGPDGKPIVEKVADVDVLNVDASKFLQNVDEIFDVIIIDFPDPSSADLARLYSTMVFDRVRERLARFGVMSIQSTSPVHAKDAFLSIGKTLNASGFDTIPYHQNVPSFGEWGWHLCTRSNENYSRDLKEKIANIEKYSISTEFIHPELFRASTIFGKSWLESDKAAVNTISNPTLIVQYLESAWNFVE
ncbi:polyamine aminopropyltransferase [Oscillatoriales cyanobacterium LEGE 11467]|uniref:Polyamine aminopropyltransferase n=1 Tax=Zarconia navalis LEGE 11467 TaxID=1828826 RepID=A0A928VV45_9CYAN|nr:polyamine aminopropyltransferase [Zarconia navalis]MBE9040716.1 polyamine aminopropyltransferase [Zarconia navalis LEGE 11467]